MTNVLRPSCHEIAKVADGTMLLCTVDHVCDVMLFHTIIHQLLKSNYLKDQTHSWDPETVPADFHSPHIILSFPSFGEL